MSREHAMIGKVRVAIKISGRYVQPDQPGSVAKYAETLRRLWDEGYRPIVVVGGGKIARTYIEAGRALGLSEAALDVLGIEVTRLNARLLASTIGRVALQRPPSSIEQLIEQLEDPLERIIVMGGLQPGQSTGAVAAIAAETAGAKVLVNASRAGGVYDKDPEKHRDARLLRTIKASELSRLLNDRRTLAGTYELIDALALDILRRARITMYVVDGSDPENIAKVLRGEVTGSVVLPE
ncbi:MAG: UMP kinase [Fervidicoccaceae archaeon]